MSSRKPGPRRIGGESQAARAGVAVAAGGIEAPRAAPEAEGQNEGCAQTRGPGGRPREGAAGPRQVPSPCPRPGAAARRGSPVADELVEGGPFHMGKAKARACACVCVCARVCVKVCVSV